MYPSVQAENKDFEGKKNYELANHLGNVLAVISDRKKGMGSVNGNYAYFDAVTLTATDYFPFGMAMPSRTFNTEGYRYGFNGKENDGEWAKQDYGARISDPRIARFLSLDPLTKSYPWYTPYQFGGNTPIQAVDLDGLEPGSSPKVQEFVLKPGYPAFKIATMNTQGGAVGMSAANYHNAGLNQEDVRTNQAANSPQVRPTRQRTFNKLQKTADAIAVVSPGLGVGLKLGLGMADDAYIDAQNVGGTPRNEVKHLNGEFTTYDERQLAGVNTTALLLPGIGTAEAMANEAIVNAGKTTMTAGESTSINSAGVYNRVKPRKGTLDEVTRNQPRNANGEMIDPNTLEPLKPSEIDLGHKPGNEWKTRKEMHKEAGSTRDEVLDAENDANLYQWEDRSANRSHKFEKKKD